jgi:hypothetical protein
MVSDPLSTVAGEKDFQSFELALTISERPPIDTVFMSRLRPIVPSRFRRRPAVENVETLLDRIQFLASERQSLRARGAADLVLERNRVQIARAQWQLSYALIQRHLPPRVEQNAA